MDEIDLKILGLKLEKPFWTDEQLARQLGITRQTISRRRNKKQFKHCLREMRNDSLECYAALLQKALRRVTELIDSDDPKVALAACSLACSTVMPVKLVMRRESLPTDPLVANFSI